MTEINLFPVEAFKNFPLYLFQRSFKFLAKKSTSEYLHSKIPLGYLWYKHLPLPSTLPLRHHGYIPSLMVSATTFHADPAVGMWLCCCYKHTLSPGQTKNRFNVGHHNFT